MKYILFTGGNGYCGCDWEEAYVFDDKDITDAYLDGLARSLAIDYAETYEYVAKGEEGWENEEEETDYYDNIYWDWTEMDEETYKQFYGQE